MTSPYTVTKVSHNRFVLEGEIAVIGERLVNEPYRRVFTTKRAAEAEAIRGDAINAAAIADLAEITAARRAEKEARLAARAERAARVPAQTSFAF